MCHEGASPVEGRQHDPKACRTGALFMSQQHLHIEQPPAASSLSGHQPPVEGAVTTPVVCSTGVLYIATRQAPASLAPFRSLKTPVGSCPATLNCCMDCHHQHS